MRQVGGSYTVLHPVSDVSFSRPGNGAPVAGQRGVTASAIQEMR